VWVLLILILLGHGSNLPEQQAAQGNPG
jgi:hypothetical protein